MSFAPDHVLDILVRDETLVAVNKPSGMLVHRGWAQDPVVAVDLLARQLGQRVWPLHRLDRGTSGVLLFALDADTARSIGRHFEAGTVTKRYLALTRGHPPAEHLVDYSLRRVDHASKARQPAQTELRLLATVTLPEAPRSGRYALVEARPRTGRTHQIRRHLKHVHHPIVGDVRYGKGEHNRYFREQLGLHRLALHASQLVVPGAEGEEARIIDAPLPADLAEPLMAMGFTLDGLSAPVPVTDPG